MNTIPLGIIFETVLNYSQTGMREKLTFGPISQGIVIYHIDSHTITFTMSDHAKIAHSIFKKDQGFLQSKKAKTKMCNFGKRCTRKVCHFAHDRSELQLAECAFGRKCWKLHSTTDPCLFIHSEVEDKPAFERRTGLLKPGDDDLKERKESQKVIDQIAAEMAALDMNKDTEEPKDSKTEEPMDQDENETEEDETEEDEEDYIVHTTEESKINHGWYNRSSFIKAVPETAPQTLEVSKHSLSQENMKLVLEFMAKQNISVVFH